MQILQAIILLIIGFIFLIKGADFFVDGSSSVARRFRVPSLVIGMTIVAMGTSLPELSVSVAASASGSNSLAVSNVVGSNIFNLMVVLGASAIFSNLAVSRDVLRRDYPFSMFCMVLLLALGLLGMELTRGDGIVFLVIFAVFLIVMVRSALAGRSATDATEVATNKMSENSENFSAQTANSAHIAKTNENQTSQVIINQEINTNNTEEATDNPANTVPAEGAGNTGNADQPTSKTESSILKDLFFILAGATAIKFGGDWVVSGAVTIARQLGVTETLIGLTIVACGTSLPELVTSIVAARKDELDMAVGNVVGSNIFNVLLILGTAAVISPIPFLRENMIDIFVLLAFSLLTWIFCVSKKEISKPEGISMIALYAVYLVYICLR